MAPGTGEDARRWLAGRGVRQTGDDAWTDDERPGRRFTTNEIAHSRAYEVFTDDHLDAEGQVRPAFGLLDLLDDYWVTCEICMADRGPDGPLPADALWAGYRRRLEAERDAEPVTYSLWVDWFGDRSTAATAFAQVLGRDLERLRDGAAPALLRRARRVLECSGSVPWPVKEEAYEAAARLPALHGALFKALSASYHDFHGDVRPEAALRLLSGLELAPDTRHLTELRLVLAEGHRNHYRSPGAWDTAVRGAS
ncbi:hypothetical protein OIE69_34370 [Actinacidiphila glaucinigra]|uniref:hypothetical protein n=1 Tax=Actinacidiphila glaucinigra TaxID=235986 RepID=UPI002DDB948A|nr:hypothetical protein [Actinacidiphila glaucinigra]WSD63612.1 hypothetical protein OIE69_34370 [Actinacidiphila glaucinigra]